MAQWEEQTSSTTSFLFGIDFIDAQRGWVATGDSCLYTIDGGRTWEPVSITTINAALRDISDIEFANAQYGIAAANNGFIFRTSNGGLNWGSPVNTGASGINFRTVSFIEDGGGHGWVGGTMENIYYTINNGGSWFIQHSGTEDINDIFSLTRSVGWAVGGSGLILKTTNGDTPVGATWNSMPSPTAEDLNGVYFFDEMNGWIVGSGGTIFSSDDGGNSWDEHAVPSDQDLYRISFDGSRQGVIVGAAGTILYTPDRGSTWIDHTDERLTSQTLYDLDCVDSENCWLAGNEGRILFSQGAISVTEPKASSQFEGGMTQPAAWTSSFVQDLSLEYSLNNGANWVSIPGSIEAALESTTWTSPTQATTTALLRLTSVNKPAIQATSSLFTIFLKDLMVSAPTSTDILVGGDFFDVMWNQSNVDLVNIRLRIDGQLDSLVATDVPASDEFYRMRVPEGYTSPQSRIYVFENDGSPIDSTAFFAIVFDSGAPIISVNTSDLTPNKGMNLRVVATISDDNATDNTLYFRNGGASEFLERKMTPTGMLNEYEATIPNVVGSQFAINEQGIEMFIQSIDQSPNNRTARWPGKDSLFTTGVRLDTFAYPDVLSSEPGDDTERYYLVSAPYQLDEPQVNTVVADDLGPYDRKKWRMWQWLNRQQRNGEFTVDGVGTFIQGNAFWIAYADDSITLSSGAGTSYPAVDFPIVLQGTWTQFGHPFAFPVSVDSVLAVSGRPPGINTIYTYDNDWRPASVLEPAKGYFVKNPDPQQDVTLVIPARSFGASSSKIHLPYEPQGAWSLGLMASTNNVRDVDNFLGASPGSILEWDVLDRPEPPPAPGNNINLFIPQRNWQRYNGAYTTDYRSTEDAYYEWIVNVTTNVKGPVTTVEAYDLEDVPETFAILLFDEVLGIRQDLRVNPSYAFPTLHRGQVKALKIIVGDPDAVPFPSEINDAHVPDRIELLQNFPNPFAELTSITYGLPEPADVVVKVYDVVGREIAVLADGVQKESGYHVLTWDGQSHDNTPIGNGIYILQMTAGDHAETLMMIRLR